MTPEEWKAAIETIGGQVLDVPHMQTETVQKLVEEWNSAQTAFRMASHLCKITEKKMHTYLQLVLPQIADWEYTFDTTNNRVTLLYKKDKK